MISLLTLITFFPRFYTWVLGSEPILVSVEELNRGVSELESKQFSSIRQKRDKKTKKYNVPASKFNPNNYSQKEWMTLGLSEKQAVIVVKFAQRGIRNNEQLKQIFVIDEALFNLIKDSTFYSEQKEWKTYTTDRFTSKQRPKIELNTATAEEFRTLYGIGEYFSNKMVEYREQLGGYIFKEQLLEIRNFDQEKFDNISNRIEVNAENIKQININTCTAEELAKHPYIRWNIANSIIKMRVQLGKYTHLDQLLKSELIDKDRLEKIRPYLVVEEGD